MLSLVKIINDNILKLDNKIMKYKYLWLLFLGILFSCTPPSYNDLITAIENSDQKLLLKYIDKGIDLNNNSEGEYPLFFALKRSNYEVVKIMVDYGADVTIKNEKGQTPLYRCYLFRRNKLTKLFAENGGDVNFQVEVDGETKPAIIDLIEKGNEELAKVFLLGNQDFNVTANKGRDIMHKALLYGSKDFMRFAIEVGVPINHIDDDGESPLTQALDMGYIDKGYIDKARLLIESEALIDNELTPWSTLVVNWDNNSEEMAKIAEIYLEKGLPIDFETDDPILSCVECASVDAMKWFLEHGFNPNLKNGSGETPIDFVWRIGMYDKDNIEYQMIVEELYALLKEYGAEFYKGN